MLKRWKKYWNCNLRTVLTNFTFCQKQIHEQWQRRDKKRITTISVSTCSSFISLNGMYEECKNNIHELPCLYSFSRSASYQGNQIELSLQIQPTVQLSSLKLISVFFFFQKTLHILMNFFIYHLLLLYFYSSFTRILHYSILVDVVFENYSENRTRKEADDEKNNSEDPASSHLTCWSIQVRGCISLWMTGRKKPFTEDIR